MKTIGLVVIHEEIGLFLEKQLKDLLDPVVKINLYILSDISEPISLEEEDLLVFTGSDSQAMAKEKLIYQCEELVANRSVSHVKLERIFEIPQGSEVYLYNDFQSSAIASVEYLRQMGFDHIVCKPLYPGMEMDPAIEHIISVGKFENFPNENKNIIEIGFRTIDISTIVEILLRLGIARERIGFFTAKYVKDIISLTNTINRISQHNEYIMNKLQTVINNMHDGLIALNEEDEITIFNRVAEEVFQCGSERVLGKSLQEIAEEDRPLYKELAQIAAVSEEIIGIHNKKLIVSHSEVTHNKKQREKLCVLKEVTEIQELEKKLRMKISKNKYQACYSLEDILGTSEVMEKQKAMAKRIARFDSPVYIYGESGTGKELFANAIHLQSERRNNPFVAVNFAAMSENLIESELFGYAEGAFTGAKKGGAPGLFEQAHGGTLFLDEIGDAPLNFQVKLLRVLQEKTVRRIGDDKVIPIDVRIIAATNKDIEKLVEEGKFREDLYYRINVLPLHIPPLRERKQDISLFVEKFYHEFTADDGRKLSFKDYFKNVMNEIENFDFPGNVRQLRNLIEYLVCTVDGVVSKEDLPPELRAASGRRNGMVITQSSSSLEEKVLKTIQQRRTSGLSAGRRSLAESVGCSEAKIKDVIESLQSSEFIIVRKGRGGIELTEKGMKTVLGIF